MAKRKRRKNNPPFSTLVRIAKKLVALKKDTDELLKDADGLVVHVRMGVKMVNQLVGKAATIATHMSKLGG